LFALSVGVRAESGRLRSESRRLRLEHQRIQGDCLQRRRQYRRLADQHRAGEERTVPSPWSSLPWTQLGSGFGQPLELVD